MTPNKEGINPLSLIKALKSVVETVYMDVTYEYNLNQLENHLKSFKECLYDDQGNVKPDINLEDLYTAVANLDKFLHSEYAELKATQLKELYKENLKEKSEVPTICSNLNELSDFVFYTKKALNNNTQQLRGKKTISLKALNNIAFSQKILTNVDYNLKTVLENSYSNFKHISDKIKNLKNNKPEFKVEDKIVDLIIERSIDFNKGNLHTPDAEPAMIGVINGALMSYIDSDSANKIAIKVYDEFKKLGSEQTYTEQKKSFTTFIDAIKEFFKKFISKEANKIKEPKPSLDRKALKSNVTKVLSEELHSSFSEKVSNSKEQTPPFRS